MRKLSLITSFISQQATSAPALLTMVSALAFGFLLATTSTSTAQNPPGGCQVCHKGNRTLTLPCQSSAVERHIAHGDTPGACGSTQSAKKVDTKTKVVAARKVATRSTAERVQRSVE